MGESHDFPHSVWIVEVFDTSQITKLHQQVVSLAKGVTGRWKEVRYRYPHYKFVLFFEIISYHIAKTNRGSGYSSIVGHFQQPKWLCRIVLTKVLKNVKAFSALLGHWVHLNVPLIKFYSVPKFPNYCSSQSESWQSWASWNIFLTLPSDANLSTIDSEFVCDVHHPWTRKRFFSKGIRSKPFVK